MRRIEILEDLHLLFPGRDAEFDLGLEIGALSVLMAQGQRSIHRKLSGDCIEQLRPIAERFAYAMVATPAADAVHFDVNLSHRSYGRPRLRLV